eukprot:scaffold881_cov123-Isochrysis_galbana.AAC.2
MGVGRVFVGVAQKSVSIACSWAFLFVRGAKPSALFMVPKIFLRLGQRPRCTDDSTYLWQNRQVDGWWCASVGGYCIVLVSFACLAHQSLSSYLACLLCPGPASDDATMHHHSLGSRPPPPVSTGCAPPERAPIIFALYLPPPSNGGRTGSWRADRPRHRHWGVHAWPRAAGPGGT